MSGKKPGYLLYIGDDVTTQLCGDYFINYEIRIPIKQPGFNSESKAGVFFVAQITCNTHFSFTFTASLFVHEEIPKKHVLLTLTRFFQVPLLGGFIRDLFRSYISYDLHLGDQSRSRMEEAGSKQFTPVGGPQVLKFLIYQGVEMISRCNEG